MTKNIIMLDDQQKTNNGGGYETHASGQVLTNQKQTSSLGGEDATLTMAKFCTKSFDWDAVFDGSLCYFSDFHGATSFLMVKHGANQETSLYCGFTKGIPHCQRRTTSGNTCVCSTWSQCLIALVEVMLMMMMMTVMVILMVMAMMIVMMMMVLMMMMMMVMVMVMVVMMVMVMVVVVGCR